MNVILQPCGNALARANYAKTIEVPVRFSGIPVFASIEAPLSSIYPTGVAPVWGITSGKDRRKIPLFRRMRAGDAVLFTKDNEVFSIGTVTFKAESSQIADYLWGQESPGVSFKWLYFLDEIKRSRIPVSELNRVVGFKENNIIHGFSILDAEKSEKAIEFFSLESLRHPPRVTAADFVHALEELQRLEDLDRKVEGCSRLEQGYLRQLLFQQPIGKCAICARELPIDLLVAAHIKRRSACSIEEKRDAEHIAMPVCKMGCDELFERGYIAVDSNGRIVTTTIAVPPALQFVLSSLNGKQCPSFDRENRHYFEWHLNTIYRR